MQKREHEGKAWFARLPVVCRFFLSLSSSLAWFVVGWLVGQCVSVWLRLTRLRRPGKLSSFSRSRVIINLSCFLVLVVSSSLFFPFSPQWVFPSFVGPRSSEFVISFCGPAPVGFVSWLRSTPGVEFKKLYQCPSWRSFGPGVAVRFLVRDAVLSEAVRKAAPKGGGGSLHPANFMR